jgi:hypothetical protein
MESTRSNSYRPLPVGQIMLNFVSGTLCRLGFRREKRVRAKRNLLKEFKLIWVVQSRARKYSASHQPAIDGFLFASRTHQEGRTRRHGR